MCVCVRGGGGELFGVVDAGMLSVLLTQCLIPPSPPTLVLLAQLCSFFHRKLVMMIS